MQVPQISQDTSVPRRQPAETTKAPCIVTDTTNDTTSGGATQEKPSEELSGNAMVDQSEILSDQQESVPDEQNEADKAIELIDDDTESIHEERDDTIGSRTKSDIFHEFYNLGNLLGRKCPAGPAISRLCR